MRYKHNPKAKGKMSYTGKGASSRTEKRDEGKTMSSNLHATGKGAAMPKAGKSGSGALPTGKTGHEGNPSTGYGIGRARKES